MILKPKDSIDGQIQDLEMALQQPLTPNHRRRIEKDLAQVRAGLKAEEEAAYHIDFDLKDSVNWAVIHDLRIEWNSRVAQIDHLLINRLLEIYVIESKSFRTKVRFANGGWERLNFNHWEGIASPVEQNERHILVLQELIEQRQIAPTRLGITLRPSFFNIVAVQPSCSVVGPKRDTSIFRMDVLMKKIRAMNTSPLGILKVITPETLEQFCRQLVSCHIPAPRPTVPFTAGKPSTSPTPTQPLVGQVCQGCGGPLSKAEAYYCRVNAAQFANQLLCRKCQSYAGNAKATRAPKPVDTLVTPVVEMAATCAVCGIGVDKKVVAFCRFNSRRFGGRVLCRTCQTTV